MFVCNIGASPRFSVAGQVSFPSKLPEAFEGYMEIKLHRKCCNFWCSEKGETGPELELCVCVCARVSASVPVYSYVCVSVSLYVCVSVYVCICVSVCLCMCVSVIVCICM